MSKGTVTFTTAPKEGVDNVDIYWTKLNESRSYVTKNTNMIYFGQANDVRVFMFGNQENPNRFIYSDLADGQMSAEYFPVTNFSDVGTANIKITDIAKQQDSADHDPSYGGNWQRTRSKSPRRSVYPDH